MSNVSYASYSVHLCRYFLKVHFTATKSEKSVKSVKRVDLSVKQLGSFRFFLHIFATSNKKKIYYVNSLVTV